MSQSAAAQPILEHLQAVALERVRRAADVTLLERVVALKSYQQRRFARTYADLLASERYAGAARFFLDELYGPRDFADRDAQFARVVPALTRLFSARIVATVRTLAELHALSEQFDTDMARNLTGREVDRRGYIEAWQKTGQVAGRERQIALTLDIGRALESYTRQPLLRRSLHLMRAPARAAGLAQLQHFLETGFDTFGEMRGAHEFLNLVAERERALAAALFETDPSRPASGPLEQLP